MDSVNRAQLLNNTPLFFSSTRFAVLSALDPVIVIVPINNYVEITIIT